MGVRFGLPELPLVSLPAGLGHSHPSLSPPRWGQPGNVKYRRECPPQRDELNNLRNMSINLYWVGKGPFCMFHRSNRKHIYVCKSQRSSPWFLLSQPEEDQICVSWVQGWSWVHHKGKKTWIVSGHIWISFPVGVLMEGFAPIPDSGSLHAALYCDEGRKSKGQGLVAPPVQLHVRITRVGSY